MRGYGVVAITSQHTGRDDRSGRLSECARSFELEAACDEVADGIGLLDLLKESGA